MNTKDKLNEQLLQDLKELKNENIRLREIISKKSFVSENETISIEESTKALIWNKVLLQMMANSSPLAYLVVDNRNDEILYFNHRFCEIWGILHLEDKMKSGILKNNDIIPDCLAVLMDIPSFAESCKPLQSEENRIIVSDEIEFSENRTIHRYTTQIRGENDEYFGRFYIFEDISERKRAEEQLRLKNIELNEMNSSKDKFFSIIAHDLKSPFNSLLGITEIMNENIEDFSSSEIKNYSTNLEVSAKLLYRLLDNLLEWSKIQRGMITFNPIESSLSNIIKQNINLQFEFAKQKNIEIENKVENDLNIISDTSMLNTILRNLISNSIKFSNRGGKVEIGAYNNTKERTTQIYIKDNGIGMSKETLSKLFKIEYKVTRQGTENESSSGLGLLLCQDFIEFHKGKMIVESEKGEGTTFTLFFPY